MEGGYTNWHIKCQTRLTEPQGKLKKANEASGNTRRFVEF